jgi:hypothetical protein
VGLVGQHERGPAVSVGLPFDASEANFGGGFTDVLQILACRVWVKVHSGGTWMSMKPVLHALLVLVFGGLVLEDVGDLADFLVVDGGDWGVRLWGTTRDAGVCLRWL